MRSRSFARSSFGLSALGVNFFRFRMASPCGHCIASIVTLCPQGVRKPADHFLRQIFLASEWKPRGIVGELKVAEIGSESQTDP